MTNRSDSTSPRAQVAGGRQSGGDVRRRRRWIAPPCDSARGSGVVTPGPHPSAPSAPKHLPQLTRTSNSRATFPTRSKIPRFQRSINTPRSISGKTLYFVQARYWRPSSLLRTLPIASGSKRRRGSPSQSAPLRARGSHYALRLPRDVSGDNLARVLGDLGYRTTRQAGSEQGRGRFARRARGSQPKSLTASVAPLLPAATGIFNSSVLARRARETARSSG